MAVFKSEAFRDHEQVLFCCDPVSGLRAIITVHSTALGSAAGGCRMYDYAREDDALVDVLRLSRGMTYKNALAGLPLGGGKCVVIGDNRAPDKAEKLRALGRHIQSLGGRYWTAVDIGIGADDADVIAESCDFVFARASQRPAGDIPTSHYTALGAFHGVKAAAAHVLGRDGASGDVSGLRVGVQGVGATGAELCRLLSGSGAALVIADVNAAAVEDVRDETGADVVAADEIHRASVDVFAPCALGGVINDQTVGEISAKIVCGIANNQLAEPRHDRELNARGIAYVPDYVVNAGGIISSGRAVFAEMDIAEATAQTIAIGETVREILERSDREQQTTSSIADRIAEERVRAAGGYIRSSDDAAGA